MQYALAASTILFASTALAAVHQVQVGPGLIFNPDSISDVAEGDTIDVTFGAGHDIVQSTFDSPCEAMEGAIFSGPSPSDGDVFSFEVNSTDPMWFFCSVGNHCQSGMALAINPTSERTIDDYKTAAEGVSSSTTPQGDSPSGGVIGTGTEESSSDSSSSASPSSSATESASESASQTSSTAEASSTDSGSGAAGLRVGMGLVGGAVAAVAAFAL
jgi:hypothetical protein